MAEEREQLSERINDLEVRYAFQEDLLRQLDEVLREQAVHIQSLQRDLASVTSQLHDLQEPDPPMVEQVPPHY